jgi:predicted Zn finger-like uncharacterized protein
MTEQPKTVVCTSCTAKFLVPDELIRGKIVKFRCRKCGAAIDVDGRKSARPPAAPPPPPVVEISGVDTPATFSQRTLPPPRPPIALALPTLSPNMHPWPEPPRTRSTTAPTSLFESVPPEESLPRLETVRDPSNRGPKIAALVALLMAAGLSGFGLAMRASPPGAADGASTEETPEPRAAVQPSDPLPSADRARPQAEAKVDDPNRSRRSPTRVTDLPPVDGVEPTPTAGTAAPAKPSEAMLEKQNPPPAHEAVNAGPLAADPHAEVLAPAPAAAGEQDSMNNPSTLANAPVAPAGGEALPNGLPPGANAPVPAVAPPLSAGRAKGDFNTQAAREALEDAAGRANKCRNIDTPTGTTARVAVTFAPTGQVTNAIIESGPFVGTSAGTCVASKFRSAKVPPFSGDSVLVRKSVPF